MKVILSYWSASSSVSTITDMTGCSEHPDLARADSMGSVYWAGLKTGDKFSMEAHSGSTLVNNNASGVTQVRWGWGY